MRETCSAAAHTLVALFLNTQLTGTAKTVLIKGDDTEIAIEEALNAPVFAFFNADGWLDPLAQIWQSGAA